MDEAVKGETASIVNDIDDDVPGDGDIPDLAPCAIPEGNSDNEDIGGILLCKQCNAPGMIKTLSDALARISELE